MAPAPEAPQLPEAAWAAGRRLEAARSPEAILEATPEAAWRPEEAWAHPGAA